MKKTSDIRELLREWPYDPEKSIRVIAGDDGREVLQVRTPVGIEQFELEGRPDGLRPHNKESAFDFYLSRLARVKAAGEETAFHLNHTECVELFEEGVLYYFRYLHLFQLEDWARTARDTTRNLRLFDFVRQYAHRKEDRQHLEQWRPYILRINGVSRAMLAVAEQAHDRALQILRETIGKIEALDEVDNQTFHVERDRSLQTLRETVEQIEKSKPLTELEKLEKQLREAVDAQAFENAAELRDKIRAVRSRPARMK
ncbi:MAG: hypothetical protein PCFJNLEI_03622 [Verrucomicrobiae bacterium]|nr:hypothetical protein [Verrucomicrobiae bacterium]